MRDPGPDRFVVWPVAPRTGTTNANKTLHLRSQKIFRIWNKTSKLRRRRLRGQFVALCTTIRSRGIDPGPKIAFSPVAPRTGPPRMRIKLLISGLQKLSGPSKVGRLRLRSQICTTIAAEEWIQVLINCHMARGSSNGRAEAEKHFVSDPTKLFRTWNRTSRGSTALSTKSVCKTQSQRNQPRGQWSMHGKRGRNPHRPMKTGGSSRSYPICIVGAWACCLL